MVSRWCLAFVAVLLPTLAQAESGPPPTKAWLAFCQTYASECQINLNEPERVAWSPALMAHLIAVNERVNATIQQLPDAEHWGVPDRWDYPDDGVGDCEDLQLLKRSMLALLGVPRRAMRMTVVIDRQGDGHAVLMVRTSQGDYILDNQIDPVLLSRATGYCFVKREGSDSSDWVWMR